VSSSNLSGNINYKIEGADANAFTIEQTSWNPTMGGKLKVAFLPAEERFYSATIVFSASSVADVVVVLNGTGKIEPIVTYTIYAESDDNGTINPNGIITVNQGDSQEFIFTPNDGYEIYSVFVDDVINSESVTLGYYIFNNIDRDHTIQVNFVENDGIIETEFDHVRVYSYLKTIYIQNENNLPIRTVEILDILGRPVYQGAITDPYTEITLQIANGIYSVRLISHDDRIMIKKVAITQ
jgi:hypothetical protein